MFLTGTWPDGSRPGWLLRSKQLKKSSGRRKVIRAKHGTGKAGTGVTTAPVIQYCLEHGPKIRRWRRRRRPPPATNEKNKNKNNKINRKERPPDRSVRNRHPIAVRRANSRPQRPGKNGVRPAGRGRRPMGGELEGGGRWAVGEKVRRKKRGVSGWGRLPTDGGEARSSSSSHQKKSPCCGIEVRSPHGLYCTSVPWL